MAPGPVSVEVCARDQFSLVAAYRHPRVTLLGYRISSAWTLDKQIMLTPKYSFSVEWMSVCQNHRYRSHWRSWRKCLTRDHRAEGAAVHRRVQGRQRAATFLQRNRLPEARRSRRPRSASAGSTPAQALAEGRPCWFRALSRSSSCE